jgi:phosphoenolpyruvate-protein phosphotransferase
LGDPDFQAAVEASIRGGHLNAEAALSDAIEAQAQRYEAMAGQRFRERAADLRDVGERVLRILMGSKETGIELPENAVILAEDLMPSQTARLDRDRVVAFVTVAGGPTSHTAILARSMGIPAVVGAGPGVLDLPEGASVAVDGYSGRVVLEPDEETREAFRAQMEADAAVRASERAASQALARTRDGQRVEVVANLATAADAVTALEAGAEGVGLLRTEFLFQDRTEPPSEDEQAAIYSRVAETMAPRPVIIRTLDIGGDKPAPYLELPEEANPFLGWRAIRISLAMPEFFKTQLRAILRADTAGNVHVMFPMIATVEEVARAQALLAEAARELTASGISHADVIPTGIMVEIPSSAQIADLLAPMVDFFSIGTNDLTQYTFAADRTNARVAGIADPLHPAVLRQIDRVIRAAHEAGRWVGLCGELAGQPEAIPVLLGLGLDEFSMSAVSIPAAKALLARLTLPEAQALAQKALTLPDGQAVRAEVKRFLSGK